MADKILVADDSLTIQKVVAITLANEPWVLVEATDESELFGKVRGGGFRLVLLDFNLSESKSGYELATEIKKLSPSTNVLAMLGTFDTVDEAGLTQAGVDGKIVKPFDSQKFIQKCRDLIDGDDVANMLSAEEEESLSFSDSSEEQESETSEDADEWVMNSPQADDTSESEDDTDTWDEDTSPGLSYEAESKSSLDSELEGWGVSIPDPIDASAKNQMEVPPVIEGKENDFLWNDSDSDEEKDSELENSIEFNSEDAKVTPISISGETEDTVYPEGGELDYPDLTIEEQIESQKSKPISNLIALDQLSNEDDEEDSLPLRLQSKPEEVREDLAREIEEELSPEDFWAVDDNSGASVSIEEHHKSEDDDDRDSFVVGVGDPQAPVDPIKPSEPLNLKIDQAPNTASSQLDEDRIVAKVKESIGPMIEEIVKRYMDEKVEKVAWEIIPDVAENLIRKELKEISQETRNS